MFRTAPFVLGIFVILVVIAAALLMFLFQQMYYVSINKTQIELDKIDKVKYKRKQEGVNIPYEHFYDHGFVQNWKEFLFPEKVEEHDPVYFEDDEAYQEYLANNNKSTKKVKAKKQEQKKQTNENLNNIKNDKMAFQLSNPKLKKA